MGSISPKDANRMLLMGCALLLLAGGVLGAVLFAFYRLVMWVFG